MYGQGLKELEEMTRPEGRSLGLHYIPEGREPEPLTLEVFHRLVGSLALNPPVDLVVHPTFDVALNLLLYTWFEGSFMHPAELQAFGSLELGLRLRLGGWTCLGKGPGLHKLLREAVEGGIFDDDALHPYPRLTGFGQAWSRDGVCVPEPEADPVVRDYIDVLCDAIPAVRNRLAHGHAGWVGTAFATLSTCRDLLNCLMPLSTEAENRRVPRRSRSI